jgi:hypothetical protein
MLLTVKDACELHPMALDYSMSEQVENLSDVIAATSATARDFFDKNYVGIGALTTAQFCSEIATVEIGLSV